MTQQDSRSSFMVLHMTSQILQLPDNLNRFNNFITSLFKNYFKIFQLTETWIVYHLYETLKQMLPTSVIKMPSA